jgi:hypothetical protein
MVRGREIITTRELHWQSISPDYFGQRCIGEMTRLRQGRRVEVCDPRATIDHGRLDPVVPPDHPAVWIAEILP